MITSILTSLWGAKAFRTGLLIVAAILVLCLLTIGIKTYASAKVKAEETRRQQEVATAVSNALNEAGVQALRQELQALSARLTEEQKQREKVDAELQELRQTTAQTVERIQRRQSKLAQMLLEKPIETAAELSAEYNDLNRSLR